MSMTESLLKRLEELVRENENLRQENDGLARKAAVMEGQVSRIKMMAKFFIKTLGDESPAHDDHLDFLCSLIG